MSQNHPPTGDHRQTEFLSKKPKGPSVGLPSGLRLLGQPEAPLAPALKNKPAGIVSASGLLWTQLSDNLDSPSLLFRVFMVQDAMFCLFTRRHVLSYQTKKKPEPYPSRQWQCRRSPQDN